MSNTTTEAFLESLRKSKLLSDPQLAKAQDVAAKVDTAKSLAKLLIKQKWLTRWQAGQLLAGRTAFFLGRYKLVHLLGRGGMGSVFAAEDTKMSRHVALKIIAKQLGKDPAALEQFFAEARAIAALDHPNIVRAYDVDNESERYFIVMEFAEGRNLQQVVEADGPLDYAVAADYIRQAADGLAHAHGREIVHRDVKPANLMVNDRGVVKVLDMGMARLVAGQADDEDGKDSNEEPEQLGTVDYLAPEQAMQSPEMDHRVDLYSLGCTLYYLLTGSPPFPDGTLAERILKHQTQSPPSIKEQRPDAPDELANVCEKLMAKEADDRFASAAEVSKLLADWQPPEEELKAAIPVAEPDAEEEPKEAIKIAEPASAEKPAAAGPFDIKIDTGGSSISRKPASSAGKPKIEPNAAVAVGKGMWADQRVLIAAAAVCALVLIGIIVGLVLVFSGGDEQDVAAADQPDEATATASADGPSEIDGDEDVEALLDMAAGDDGLDEVEALLNGGKKDTPEEEPDAEMPATPDEPTEPAGEDAKKPDTDAPKAPADPEPEPGETKKPQGDAEKKPDATPKPAETPKTAETTKPAADTPKKPDEKKPAPAKPKPKANPLAKLKEFVAIPELLDRDPPGEKSRTPLPMGPIDAPDDAKIQMFLLGGEDVLKGKQKFTLTAETGSKTSWLVQLDATTGGEQVLSPVARFSRAGKELSFQWADEARTSSANYLKNCILQIRLDGQSKFIGLAEPLLVEPIVLDLLGGRANQVAMMKWLPGPDKLRIDILGVEGRKDVVIQPEEPVPPKTRIGVAFTRKDRHGNTSPAVQLTITPTAKRTSVLLDVRLTVPPEIAQAYKQNQLKGYTAEQLGTMGDRMANEKSAVARKLTEAKGGERDELSRKIDLFDYQMWYLDFYINNHKQTKLHYRIFTEVGERKVVLAASTTKSFEPVEPAKPAAKPPAKPPE